jgi:hypothetical protein
MTTQHTPGSNAALMAAMLAALKSADQEITQLCSTVNTCAARAGLGRKVRAEDWGEKVRAAIAQATGN